MTDFWELQQESWDKTWDISWLWETPIWVEEAGYRQKILTQVVHSWISCPGRFLSSLWRTSWNRNQQKRSVPFTADILRLLLSKHQQNSVQWGIKRSNICTHEHFLARGFTDDGEDLWERNFAFKVLRKPPLHQWFVVLQLSQSFLPDF